jgi:hypothetical protein
MGLGEAFTADEKHLLKRHVEFYWPLDSGARVPTTDDQRHFVAICRGKTRPRTRHEETYQKLRAMVTEYHFDACEWVRSGFPDVEKFCSTADATIPLRLCAKCNSPIPPQRIEIVPDAEMCVPCQSGDETVRQTSMTEMDCPRCADKGVKSVMIWRTAREHSRSGYFLGCSSFPNCRYIAGADE